MRSAKLPSLPASPRPARRRSANSTNGFSSLPEVDTQNNNSYKESRHISVGKEVFNVAEKQAVGNDERENPTKEVAGWDGAQPVQGYAYGLDNQEPRVEETEHQPRRRRRRRRWIWIAIAVILIVIGIGLGVGLGLGLKTTGKAQTNVQSGPSSDDNNEPVLSQYSTRGAFNGTGISVVTNNVFTNADELPAHLVMFFQHHSGEIRWMQSQFPGSWEGGSSNEVIATDARNGTPIAAQTPHTSDGSLRANVFYINQDNFVRQRIYDNTTRVWRDGPLNDMNMKASSAAKAGLEACFYSGPIENADLTGTDSGSGIRLWVATSETTFDQLAYRDGLSQWVWEQSWPNLNGLANPACYGFDAGSTTYVMFVDLQNNTKLYWRDTDTGVESTATHPINEWTDSGFIIPDVDPTAGLTFHANFYAKMAESGMMQGYNVSTDAENSAIVPSTVSTVDGKPGINGTYLHAWTVPTAEDSEDDQRVLLFYQTIGDDITMYCGNSLTGEWNETSIGIPD